MHIDKFGNDVGYDRRLETSRTENIAKLNEYNLRLDTILDIL